MNPWVESVAVALLAFGGVGLGLWFSRLPRPYWTLGYFIPLSLILLYGASRLYPMLAFVHPISWLLVGRNKYAIIGVITTMVLTTPLSRLPQQRSRIAVAVLMAAFVLRMAVWPFLAPAFIRSYLANLPTNVDANGVCRQSNAYNCGPAAAVTALRILGLRAEEGEIAILASANSVDGTEPDILSAALNRRYGKDGLVSEYRFFKNVAELKNACPALAVVKFSFLTDHFVTVIEINDSEVVVGDPLSGLERLSQKEFCSKWRFSGVVLKRNSKM